MSRLMGVLGADAVVRPTVSLSRDRLRILAYHGVSDPLAFRRQLEYLGDRYCFVTGDDVMAALSNAAPLPDRALWITFDDGQRSVVEHGLPELSRVGAVGTMFVCPGLIVESRPFWWSVVKSAVDQGPTDYDGRSWLDQSLIGHLKAVPDANRRSFVATLSTPAPDPLDQPLDEAALVRWLDAGMEVGNHSWDHPMLDQCPPEEQRIQIERAHEYLSRLLGRPPRLFAYPNGNVAPASRQVLKELGYKVALEFDHRLSGRSDDPLGMSRLRIDADAPVDRTAAIASGTHSAVFALMTRASEGVGRFRSILRP